MAVSGALGGPTGRLRAYRDTEKGQGAKGRAPPLGGSGFRSLLPTYPHRPHRWTTVPPHGVGRYLVRVALASSASIAVNSFSMARAEGAPSISFTRIVSASSFRTSS